MIQWKSQEVGTADNRRVLQKMQDGGRIVHLFKVQQQFHQCHIQPIAQGYTNVNFSYSLNLFQVNAQFLYSITIYMLHYNPRHVSSSTLLIFRRTNCVITASGIITLEICERSYLNKMRSAVLLKTQTLWYYIL